MEREFIKLIMKIGIFDSGIGGLTVLKELIKYPNEYYYFGDNTNIPYGSKSIQELKILSSRIIEFLLTKKVEIIIIACGTVSTNISEHLKNKYRDIPIYDVISPILEIIDNNTTVMATQATVNSGKFPNAVACPLLVPLIEKDEDATCALTEYLAKIKTDKVVLGCTHYPILENQIHKINPQLKIINMGKVLCEKLNLPKGKMQINFYFGKVDECLIKNINRIIKIDYTIEEIKL